MLTLGTLGGVALFREGKPLGGRSSQRRRLALLAMLAVARDRGISRDKAISYLWPEHDTNRARHALSQLLYAIRRDLGEDCINAGIDDLRLNSHVIATDVDAFEQARAEGNLDAAAAAYGGSFLDGFFITNAPEFEAWAAGERQRLESAFAEVLKAQARVATERGDPRRAAEWLLRRLQLEPLNAQSIVELMTAFEAAGDRGEALRHGRRYVAQLQAETGLAPSTVVQALMARMAGAQAEEATPSAPIASGEERVIESRPARVQDVPGTNAPATRLDRYAVARRRRPWKAAAVVVALLFVVTSVVRTFGADMTPRSAVLSVVEGPDSSLSLAVAEVLGTELAVSGALRLLGPASIHQTLLLMKLDPTTPLGPQIALELAERRGIPFVIATTVAPWGRGARVTVRLLETSGVDSAADVLVAEATAEEEVVPVLRRLAKDLEARIAGRSVVKSDSLPAVSTASLPALRRMPWPAAPRPGAIAGRQ
jgi:DNA-binding SARP family transcriptional activator